MADFVAGVRAEEAAAADRAAAIMARHYARMDAAVAHIDGAADGAGDNQGVAEPPPPDGSDNDVGDPFVDDEWFASGDCGVMCGGSGDMLGADADDNEMEDAGDAGGTGTSGAGAAAAAAPADSGSDDDGQDCVICMDTVAEAGVIECCEHVFCYDCILTWAKRTNLCPCCRKRCVRGGTGRWATSHH